MVESPNNTSDTSVRKPRHGSWWWGVIPAVAAVGILGFWLTGQFEEMFGIDPRGTWRTAPEKVIEMYQPPDGEAIPLEHSIRWQLLVEDVAGDLWLKLYRDKEEIFAGPAAIDGNNIMLKTPEGSFTGFYYTDAVSFRYHPFARRYIDAVVRLGPGEAYALNFKRG
jgi:hypothetical protein